MSTPINVLWDLVGHAGRTTITHVGKRLDRAAGLDHPPTPPVMPGPPVFQPPTFSGPPPTLVPPMPTAQATRAEPTGTSYSDQVAQGVACLNCTRGHMATAKMALEQAQQAAAAGDTDGARRGWAVAAAELDAMVAIDWSAEKLANTPAEDRAVIEAIRPCVQRVRDRLPTPAPVALAYGSAEEAKRFASSTRFTERDAAEIEVRLQTMDEQGNYAERAVLDPADPAHQAAATALREGRHVIDAAVASGAVYDVQTLALARQYFEAAAIAATPAPGANAAADAARQCTACLEQFHAEFFGLMKARRAERGH